MATINGTFNSLIGGTISGQVGTPGPQGPAGPTGSQGPAGAPGVGVPAGGLTAQILSKASGTSYDTAWTTLSLTGYATESWVTAGFYPLTGNPSGFITGSALSPYALINSQAFTGTPSLPTGTIGVTQPTLTSTTQLATTAFVQQELLSGTANARNLEVYVRNQTGSTIPAGSIVFINGATGNRPTITLAQANNDANSAQTMGFTKTAIANNGFGFVVVRGEVENLNTSALTEGVQLYLSPTTAGTWTTTKPSAPQHLVYVGICVRAHPTLGVILVAVQNGYELPELHDVKITSPTNGQVLKYDSAQSLWVNGTDSAPVTSVAGRTGAITLSNTDISGLGTMATATATDYLSKAGNLAGLASTSTARTNLGLGTISTFNDAPSNGSTYGRQNGAWVVAGGGGSLPAVQIAASRINPLYIDCTPVPHCLALAYPSKTEILNGIFATGFSYTNDPDSNPALTLTGLTSMMFAYVNNNQAMTSGPNFTNCTSLVGVTVESNGAMTTGPNFTGCSDLTTVTISSNSAMTTLPVFTGCTSLTTVNIIGSGSLTAAPNFSGFTTLTTLVFTSCNSSTQAPNLTGCASINAVDVRFCQMSSTNILAMCVQIYNTGAINGYLQMTGDSMPYFDGQNLPYQIMDLQGAGWTVEFNDSNPP